VRSRQKRGAATAAGDGDPEREGRQDSHDAAARRLVRRRGLQPADHGSIQLTWERDSDGREGEEPDELRGGAEPGHDEWRTHVVVGAEHGTHLRDERGARARAAAAGRWWARRTGTGDTGVVHRRHGGKAVKENRRLASSALMSVDVRWQSSDRDVW